MGLSNYIPNSRISQAGVVPNEAARPASPYEGQVIYQQDTDRTLVWNGTAWVDPSTGKSGRSGLVLVGNSAFTNVASFDVTGFSSTYDFYKFNLFVKSVSGTPSITAELYSGATARTTGYYGGSWYAAFDSSSGIYSSRNNGANFVVVKTGSTNPSTFDATIHGVGNTDFTITFQGFDSADTRGFMGSFSNYAATNSFDMIRFSSSPNVTGYWYLYGYNQ